MRISVMNIATHLPADEAMTCREQILSDCSGLAGKASFVDSTEDRPWKVVVDVVGGDTRWRY